MTNLVESTLTEVLVEEAQGLVVESVEATLVVETTASGPDILAETTAVEATLVVETTASGPDILAETTAVETVTEATVETLFAVEPETFLLDVGAQGPAGPQGPPGTADSYPGKTLVYSAGRVSEVLSYSDAAKTTLVERRVLGYSGGSLSTVQFYDGAGVLVKTRTLTYSDGVLVGMADL